MRIGIIGCGFIGTSVAEFVDNIKDFQLIGLNDIDKTKVEFLIKKLKNKKPKFMILKDLIKKCDLIIESASKGIIKKILSDDGIDKKGKKLLVMSTGGLIQNLELLKKIKYCEIILPSGAVSGLDSIKSVSKDLKSLSLTTTKPVKGLEGAPYLTRNNINLKNMKSKKKVVFEGNLQDAIEGFPQNINVAATLFLASGFEGIKIRIIADPKTRFNTHEITAAGDFGKICTLTENLPSKNPRTSYLAVLSAIQAVKNIKNNIKIGN